MRLDLHIHTTASDGSLPPEAIVEGALQGGLDIIAITDHDTTASVDAARRAAEGSTLRVLAGAEISSVWNGHSIHVLGYGVDPESPAMIEHQERAQRARFERMGTMLDRLRAIEGIEVTMEAVLEAAGPDREMLGRPHLARVLVQEGHARDLPDAFDRYIADERPAYVPTDLLTPAGAIELIDQAGGAAVWAHPPFYLLHDLMPSLVEAGLRGLEVYRPELRPAQIRTLSDAARSRGLVATGGSDWHNLRRNRALGAFWVAGSQLHDFLSLMGIQR